MTTYDNAAPWKPWYSTAAWIAKSKAQRRTHPYCRYCDERGIATPAQVADHVIPHRGDPELFWNGELQSLCRRCHAGHKQTLERTGYTGRHDKDGYPVEPSHPANRTR